MRKDLTWYVCSVGSSWTEPSSRKRLSWKRKRFSNVDKKNMWKKNCQPTWRAAPFPWASLTPNLHFNISLPPRPAPTYFWQIHEHNMIWHLHKTWESGKVQQCRWKAPDKCCHAFYHLSEYVSLDLNYWEYQTKVITLLVISFGMRPFLTMKRML